MSILISGSLAYDHIMNFPDSFRHHILPEQIHMLNVSFVVDQLKKNIGGCAGNIAYTTQLLGGEPVIIGTLGSDADKYLQHLTMMHIGTSSISISKTLLTSSAYITTDKSDNQITAFYPGAGSEMPRLPIANIHPKPSLAIISPTATQTMLAHAHACHELGIPFCFDPGQQVPALSAKEIMTMIDQATILIANDYEMKLIQEKTGWNATELVHHVEIVITTLGEKGSLITTAKEARTILPCPSSIVADPTGAGDAYRAGFFTAYTAGKDLQTCGQIGSVAAVYAVENYGTQHHTFTPDEFALRYEKVYGEKVHLPF